MATFFIIVVRKIEQQRNKETKSFTSLLCFFVVPNKKPADHAASGFCNIPVRLTFAELETFASARLAVFFALTHTRIAGQQAFRLQRRTKSCVREQQRARNAVTHCTGLARRPAAADVHTHVELVR